MKKITIIAEAGVNHNGDLETAKKLVKAAKEYHVILEVNNASLSAWSFRGDPRERYQEMLALCQKYQVPVVMDSDAHVDSLVGEHGNACKVLEQAKFPQELIVNANPMKWRGYFNHWYDV